MVIQKNTNKKLLALQKEMNIDPKKMAKYLENFIRKYSIALKKDGVVLGLSWWIDSTLVAVLCTHVVWGDNTLALIMPEKDLEKTEQITALAFAKSVWIQTKIIDISSYLEKIGAYTLFFLDKIPFLNSTYKGWIIRKVNTIYKNITGHPPFLDNLLGTHHVRYNRYFNKEEAYYRVKHRIRMVLLYFYGELQNKMVVGAANKTEHMIWYFVQQGCDSVSDIMPIMNLYKTQVIQLAEYLGLPKQIIEKKPTGGTLWNITDEEAIWLSYKILDLILLALEKWWTDKEIASVLELEEETVLYVKEMIKRSEHMRHVYVPE